MSRKADAVVIGGGIVGSAITAFLAEKMDRVILVEREGIASRASGSNYGMAWIQPRRPGFELEIAQRSIEIYHDFMENQFDIDIEWEAVGGLTVGTTPSQAKAIKWYCDQKNKMGVPVENIDGKEVLELEPNLTKDVTGAVYCKYDNQLNPMATTLAFANLARRRGAEIHSGVVADRVVIEKDRVTGVETSVGRIETPKVVIAAGCWSRFLCRDAGIEIPVFPQRLQSLVTEPMDRLLTRTIQGSRDLTDEEAETHPELALDFDFPSTGDTEDDLPKQEVEDTIFAYLKPTVSGTIVLGTTNEFAGYDRRTTTRGLSAIMKACVRLCPGLDNTNIIRTWAALIPFTFDSRPILGGIDEVEGMYIATGHPHAFSHAPTVGEIFGTLLTDPRSLNDFQKDILAKASFSRFRK